MTGLPIFLRPSVKITTLDLTQRVTVIEGTTGAIVGAFERGPVKPTYQSGLDEDFRRLYGLVADPTIGFGHDTATSFMTQSKQLLVNRVTKDAKYSKLSVLKDNVNNSLFFVDGPGTDNGYDAEGLESYYLITVDDDLVTANVISLDITDGNTVETATTTYAISHTNTWSAFAAAVQVTLNSFGVGSSATVLDPHTILVRIAKTMTIEFSDYEVTLGTTQANTDIIENAHLFDVFAENPGKWANNYGIVIDNIDPGVRQRFRLTIAGPLINGNAISVNVNGTAVSTVYTTNSDTTLADFAAALDSNPDIESAEVESVPGASNNDRSILIIAKKPGNNTVVFDNLAVTGGATQVASVVTSVMTGVDPDHSFRLRVYERSNLNLPVETFTVSLRRQLNSMGYQQNIEHVVNRASTRSLNIRVLQTAESFTDSLYDEFGTPITVPTTVRYLRNGDDGLSVTSAEVRQGWLDIEDRVQYPVDVLLNAGYTAISVQKEMVALAERRSDCIAILDAPSDRQHAQDLRDYRMFELDIDSTYGAMYTPDVEIEDINTAERRYIPPSGPVGATYAYSDRLTQNIGAPAGLNRGKVTLAVGLRHIYTDPQEELLFPIGINVIKDRPKVGPVVMGEETLQSKKTVLSSVHARRILNRIKVGLADGLDYVLFDPNTEWTRIQATELGHTLLRPMTRGDGMGGLYDYRIVCDSRNNTPDVIDAEQLAYDVYLKIVQVIKGIHVRAILTRTGANFEELIDQLS